MKYFDVMPPKPSHPPTAPMPKKEPVSPEPAAPPVEPIKPIVAKVQPKKLPIVTKKKLLMALKYASLLIGASLLVVILAALAELGQILLGLTAIPVIIKKIDSRLIFGLALIALTLIPIFQLLGYQTEAQNIAVLAYISLVIGTIELGLETRRNGKLSFGKH